MIGVWKREGGEEAVLWLWKRGMEGWVSIEELGKGDERIEKCCIDTDRRGLLGRVL